MSTDITVKNQLQSLIDTANEKTGGEDTTLTDAVGLLVEGFGGDISKFGYLETKTAAGQVVVDYVNENDRNIQVQLSSDTITDFSGLTITKQSKNLFDKGKLTDFSDWTISDNAYYSFPIKVIKGLPITVSLRSITESGFDYGVTSFGITSSTGTFTNNTLALLYYKDGTGLIDEPCTFIPSNDVIYITGSFINKLKYDTFKQIFLETLQIEYGIEVTDYEPYPETVYPVNADGTVDGVTANDSVFTALTCSDETIDITAKYYCVPDVEWHRFWDDYQEYGFRTDNRYLGSGVGWTNETFKPKYDMHTNFLYAFYDSGIKDLYSVFKKQGITFKNIVNFTQVFNNSKLVRIPPLDLKSVTNQTIRSAFQNATSLETIDEIQNASGKIWYTNTFNKCSSLKNITFVNSNIGQDINFQWSPLTVESAISIINSLVDYSADTTNAYKYTLTLSSDTWVLLAAEGETSPSGTLWKDYIDEKGWMWA